MSATRYWIAGATVVRPGEGAGPGSVLLADGLIAAVSSADAPAPDAAQVIDATGLVLTPGLIDLHTHGIGRHLYEQSAEDLIAGLRLPARYGTTTVLPTLYSCLRPEKLEQVRRLAEGLEQVRGIDAPGFHLEGPFLAISGAGGMTMKADAGFLEELLSACGGKARIMSLSPDVPGIIAIIERLVERGIVVFLTHTRASVEQTQAAVDAGARHATHFYDVFPLPPEPEPGVRPVGAVEVMLGDRRASVDFICDGVHVHPAAIRAALAAKGIDGVMAITDSNIGAGLAAGRYDSPWGYAVDVSPRDAARIAAPDARAGHLAGSSLTLNAAVANLGSWLTDRAMHEVWAMGTRTPARVAGLADRGVIRTGARANLVLWKPDLTAVRTWVDGEEVFNETQQPF